MKNLESSTGPRTKTAAVIGFLVALTVFPATGLWAADQSASDQSAPGFPGQKWVFVPPRIQKHAETMTQAKPLPEAKKGIERAVASFVARGGSSLWLYVDPATREVKRLRFLGVEETTIRLVGRNRYSAAASFQDAKNGRPMTVSFLVNADTPNWSVAGIES